MNKYINDDENSGILYDWRKIAKRIKSLEIPDGVFYPDLKPVTDGNKFIIQLSERSTGKTTGWLLVGLCMYVENGATIEYIRATEDEIRPATAQKLVEVLNTYRNGHYIETLTDGKYNHIIYHWRAFYLARLNIDGEVEERDDNAFMHILAINKHLDYKSTYNSPTGDLILFDEFIGKYYRPDEFWNFLDLVKTIQRNRLSPIIIMTANTLNRNSMYFEEMGISSTIKLMNLGDKRNVVTPLGTKIYIELLNVEQARKKAKLSNLLFYGFNNPKISAITGDNLWNFEKLPHIYPDEEKTILYNKLYMEIGGELLKLDIVSTYAGVVVECHRATRTYDDSVILTLNYIQPDESTRDGVYYYGLGDSKSPMSILLKKLINTKRVYFSSNEVGNLFNEFIQRLKY